MYEKKSIRVAAKVQKITPVEFTKLAQYVERVKRENENLRADLAIANSNLKVLQRIVVDSATELRKAYYPVDR